jgi:hypothetical protein
MKISVVEMEETSDGKDRGSRLTDAPASHARGQSGTASATPCKRSVQLSLGSMKHGVEEETLLVILCHFALFDWHCSTRGRRRRTVGRTCHFSNYNAAVVVLPFHAAAINVV